MLSCPREVAVLSICMHAFTSSNQQKKTLPTSSILTDFVAVIPGTMPRSRTFEPCSRKEKVDRPFLLSMVCVVSIPGMINNYFCAKKTRRFLISAVRGEGRAPDITLLITLLCCCYQVGEIQWARKHRFRWSEGSASWPTCCSRAMTAQARW